MCPQGLCANRKRSRGLFGWKVTKNKEMKKKNPSPNQLHFGSETVIPSWLLLTRRPLLLARLLLSPMRPPRAYTPPRPPPLLSGTLGGATNECFFCCGTILAAFLPAYLTPGRIQSEFSLRLPALLHSCQPVVSQPFHYIITNVYIWWLWLISGPGWSRFAGLAALKVRLLKVTWRVTQPLMCH